MCSLLTFFRLKLPRQFTLNVYQFHALFLSPTHGRQYFDLRRPTCFSFSANENINIAHCTLNMHIDMFTEMVSSRFA